MGDDDEQIDYLLSITGAMLSVNRKSSPNDSVAHQARVDAAREAMGTRYLCHPANHVRPIINYPIRVHR